MKKFTGLFLIFTCICATAKAETTGLYSAIDPLPFDAHGWFVNEFALDRIFREKQIKTVIELGSWVGASTRFLALRVGQNGKVYAVDTWKGTPSNAAQIKDPRLPNLFRLFLSNVIHMGLTNTIVPVPMTTDEAAKFLNVKADLIYFDADPEQVEKDILNWFPHLNEGGIFCGTNWNDPQVQAGAERATMELGRQIDVDSRGIFWRIH